MHTIHILIFFLHLKKCQIHLIPLPKNKMMAHLAPVTPPTPKPLISTFARNAVCLGTPTSLKLSASKNAGLDQETPVQRRNVAFGLVGVVLGLSIGGGSAWAAARRPPPPPPVEKKDPNVTGLAAKILASKKRKEAMKESIAKLKEKGKVVSEPSQ